MLCFKVIPQNMALKATNPGLRSRLSSRWETISNRFNSIELPERFKGTFVEKMKNYWKQLILDYKDVVVETGKDMRDRPVKAGFYLTLLGSGYYFTKTNPDEKSFWNEVRKCQQKVMVLGEDIRNPKTVDHLVLLERWQNEGIVRRLTLGVVSVIWLDNYDKGLGLYKATCSYLKPKYFTFHERIIDVGFMGEWWKLKQQMVDYDVNYKEWEQEDEENTKIQ